MTLLDAPAPSSGAFVPPKPQRLVDHFEYGLDAPICLTWELTYACNLSCVHCLSSSGRRDPRELSTEECFAIIDELQRMQVFYVNIGGGEPTVRPDFWEIVDYATAHNVGVKFSTNGVKITPERAEQIAANDYIDVQISLDGATPEVNDWIRGPNSYAMAMQAMENMQAAGMKNFKLSVVCTRQNIPQLDEFKAIADQYGAQLRLTRLRPSGRAADVWDELHPLPEQQRELFDWLVAHDGEVLTGDSFFHLAAYGQELQGLNLCGAGRVVCLIDPIGDVYACPFAIHDEFLAGSVRDEGGFQSVWRESELFTRLRQPQSGGACSSCQFFDSCKGGCMAAKFFTGLPMDGPDPECVQGFGEQALEQIKNGEMKGDKPKPSGDHSHRTTPPRPRQGPAPTGMGPVRVTLSARRPDAPPVSACDESPVAGLAPARLSGRRSGVQAPPASACDESPLAGFAAELAARQREGGPAPSASVGVSGCGCGSADDGGCCSTAG